MDDFDGRLITGLQVRMARGALGWGVQKLGEHANVNKNTIVRFEHNNPTTPPTIEKIRRTLESEGIDFIWHDGKEGIMSLPDQTAGLPPSSNRSAGYADTNGS